MQEVIKTTTGTGEDATVTTDTLSYYYDANSTPLAVDWNGALYYYVANPQGDVMALVDSTGTAVVNYTYDAWGNVLTTTGTLADNLGTANALRYRSYVYDAETELYYLQSRYYNPEIGRFINADAFTATGQGTIGNNMFAYCLNNPVCLYDDSGTIPRVVEDKIIHDMVLDAICNSQKNLTRRNTCIYYNGESFWGGWGFCDLYNTVTGEVWELKKQSQSYSCKTSTALAQLGRYVTGRLKNNMELPLCMPYTTEISSGSFSFESAGYTYNVSYWSENNGILRYNYTKQKTETLKTVEAVATAVALISVAVVFPVTAPAIATAGFCMVLMP